MTPKYYQKKPIRVQAEQFWPDQKPWPEGVEKHNVFPWAIDTGMGMRTMRRVCPEDWIVTHEHGHKEVIKPDIFEATYEEVPE